MRRLAFATAALLALMLACGWWFGRVPDLASQGVEPAASAHPGSRNQTPGLRGDPHGLSAREAGATVTAREVAALQDRDQRRRVAMAQFQGGMLVGIDRCLSAGPGPRSPQRFVLHFERSRAGDTSHERFTLVALDPVDAAPNQPSSRQSPAWACFAGLAGRTVDIPVGAASQESSFQEVVAIPLPTSVGWAATAPRPLRMP